MTRLVLTSAFAFMVASGAFSQAWTAYGGNAQHTAIFTGKSQSAGAVHWQASLDDDRSYYGGGVLIHYASPVITPANTVVHSFRFTTTVNSTQDYDNWRVIGRAAKTGQQIWSLNTDFSAPLIWPNDWTSVYPLSLVTTPSGAVTTTGVAAGGAGGTVLFRNSADAASAIVTRIPFYTTLQDYTTNAAAYAPIKINTPFTSDAAGNIYFGYLVTGTVPSNLAKLGTAGVVKMNPSTGISAYMSVQNMNVDPSISQVAMNAAPVLSNDGQFIYAALCQGGGGAGWLVKLNNSNLAKVASVAMRDPSVDGPASAPDVSSASPMVGPDGHVFFGAFRNQYGESHGWMLQYDQNLNPNDANGVPFPTGAFGWDDTAAVVPSYIVPSYHGKATYLLLTKYNDYADFYGSDPGAIGDNHVAIIDPTSNSISRDRQTGIPVMNEILLVLGPTRAAGLPVGCCEWCINSAAVDIQKKGAIINSEDGHMYRWDFGTNKLIQGLNLEPPTGEAYTSTVIGPDGTLFAINNSVLFAIGDPAQATSVSVYQGTTGRGIASDVWTVDGLTYSTGSVPAPAGSVAAIEADFSFPNPKINGLDVSASASAALGVTGYLYAYNYTTQQFVLLGGGNALKTTQTAFSASTSTNGSEFISPTGQVRVLVRAVVPAHVSPGSFTLAADLITCSTH